LYLVYQDSNAAFQAKCAADNVPMEDRSLIKKIFTDFKGVNKFWMLMVLVAFMLSNISRAIRWKMLIKPMGYNPKVNNLFLTTMLGYFANLGLPRIGEAIKIGALSKYEKIPAEKITGTWVVDRGMDVLSLLIMIGLAFLVSFSTLWNYLSENMNLGDKLGGILQNPFVIAILALGVIGLIAFFALRKKIMQTKIYKKILDTLKGFWEGILTVKQLENPSLFLFHSFSIWFLYYLMNYLCFFAFAPTAHLTPGAALMVFVFGALGMVIPSPGGMGSYQWLITQALVIYGISPEDGFSFANILFFSIQIFCNIFFGLIALILLPLTNKNYIPDHEKQIAKPTASITK